MRLGVSPAAALTPRGAFNQRFEALFPRAGALVCVVCFAACHSSGLSGLSVRECGAAGSASGQTACPVRPTLCQSRSRHGHANPLRLGARLRPSYRSGWRLIFLSPWCQTSLPFDSLSVLVVRGGAVCVPTQPSWFSWSSYYYFLSSQVVPTSALILKVFFCK